MHRTCNCDLGEVEDHPESSMAAPGLQDRTSQGWRVVREDASWGSWEGGRSCSAVAFRQGSVIGHGKDECDRARERHVPDDTFGNGSVGIGLHDKSVVFRNKKKEDMKARSAVRVEAMRGNIKSTGIDFPGYRMRMKSELTLGLDWSGAQSFCDRFWFERVASCGCCKKRGNAGMITGRTWLRSRLHVLDESVGQELRWPEGRAAGHAGNA
jgi:hypothetical protein